MKIAIILAVCVVAALGAPSKISSEAQERRMLPALIHEETHDDLGQFALRYVTVDGTVVVQRGRLVPTPEGNVLVYDGEFSFIGDDGKTYITKYTTDIHGGYQVSGDHLPKSPEPQQVPKVE